MKIEKVLKLRNGLLVAYTDGWTLVPLSKIDYTNFSNVRPGDNCVILGIGPNYTFYPDIDDEPRDKYVKYLISQLFRLNPDVIDFYDDYTGHLRVNSLYNGLVLDNHIVQRLSLEGLKDSNIKGQITGKITNGLRLNTCEITNCSLFNDLTCNSIEIRDSNINNISFNQTGQTGTIFADSVNIYNSIINVDTSDSRMLVIKDSKVNFNALVSPRVFSIAGSTINLKEYTVTKINDSKRNVFRHIVDLDKSDLVIDTLKVPTNLGTNGKPFRVKFIMKDSSVLINKIESDYDFFIEFDKCGNSNSNCSVLGKDLVKDCTLFKKGRDF